MKVIFLDFNGVLDTWEKMDKIDPDNLKRLMHIVKETGAKIVLSSSVKNRYFVDGVLSYMCRYLIDTLTQNDLEVIGMTPYASVREEEINLYLQAHPEIDSFCILDDDYYMESLKDNLVKLPSQMNQYSKGLEDVHVSQAIKILNTKTLRK